MSEQEVEEQISSEETLDDETGEENGTPDNTSKNKSNFKKLSQKAKEAEARATRAEAKLAEWEALNPEIDPSNYKKDTDDTDVRTELFLIKNPDAEEHMDKLEKFTSKWFSLKEAWEYVKPTIPEESQTEKDFDIKSKWTTKKVDLSKVSFEEIYSGEYSTEQKAQWRSLHE